MAFFVFLLLFSVLFVTVEILQRYILTKNQWSRKATHVLAGLLLVPMPVYLSKIEIIVLSIIFGLCLIVSRLKNVLSLHNVDRNTIGEILYPLSIGILALLCLPENIHVFQISAMLLAFSDGFAAIFGTKFPVRQFRIYDSKKSVGGALTFFVTSCAVLFLFPDYSSNNHTVKIMTAAILTALEFFLVLGLDNIAIPVVAALLLQFFL